MIDYLKDSILPEEETKAKEAVLSSTRYTLIDDVLYFSDRNYRLRIVAPKQQRKKLFEEAHSGCFGGHVRDGKVYGQLSKHYWWPKMRPDIIHWLYYLYKANNWLVDEKCCHSPQYLSMAPFIELALMPFSLPNHTKGTATP